MATVLCIEPDKVLAESYYLALTSAGHDVVVTPSAQTAIVVADEINPDIVILELQLIEHSGIEFLYELRSYLDWQGVPVIIQTQVPPSEFNNNYQILNEHLGINTYLYKPSTTLRDLIHAVHKELSKSSQLDADQEEVEQRSKSYSGYDERVAEASTKVSASNVGGVGDTSVEQVDVLRSFEA